MKRVEAIIECASDGTYSVYMDADMDYLVTGTGSTAAAAIDRFKAGYEDMRRIYTEEGKPFTEVEFEFVGV